MKRLIAAAVLAAGMTFAPCSRADDATAEQQYPVYDNAGCGWYTSAWQDGLEACILATYIMIRKACGDTL